MKVKLYSVYDSKAGIYQQLNPFRNADEAIRAIADSANDPNSTLFKFAEDFSLFEMGTYDDDTGIIESHAPIMVVPIVSLSRAHNQYYAARNMDKAVA